MAAATHSAAGPQQQMQQPKVQSVEPDGTTPLHRAAQRNDLGTAERLVRTGANVNAANRYGVTPLSLACVNGNAPMIEMLLKAGADANSTLPEGETALMTAANTGNVAALRALLAHGATVNATESSKGQTALMWAVNKGHTAAASMPFTVSGRPSPWKSIAVDCNPWKRLLARARESNVSEVE